MSPRPTPLSTVTRLLVAVLVAAAVLVAPVRPAHAVRVPETLAHSAVVGNSPVRPGFDIEYLGVVWDGEPGPAAARFLAGNRWGPWIDLEEDGAQAVGQYGTQLVAAGSADAYQVRVAGHAINARAVAINVTDGDKVQLAGTAPPRDSAGAATAVVTRAEWGADESLRFEGGREIWPPAYYEVQKLTVHHTATSNDDPDPAGTVRAIYRYHAVDKGWGDIGYQYLIDEAGAVYEGRWSGTDGDVAHDAAGDLVTAAHVGGYNSGNAGVALLGDFRRRSPDAPAQASLEAVLADLAARHSIDPEGSGDYVNPVNGAIKSDLAHIPAHRDWEATQCPGTRLYDLLPEIRANVAALLEASSSTTTTTAAETTTTTAAETTTTTAAETATTTTAVSQITLTASGSKEKGLQKVDLSWTGAGSADVYWSDGSEPLSLLAAGATSPHRHNVDRRGGGTYTYEVRADGVSSNRVTVTF